MGTGFVRSVSALLVGSGAQLAGSVGSALLATLILPVDQRGLMVVMVTLASFVGIVGGAGVGNAFRRRLPTEPDADRLAADYTWLVVALIVVAGLAGASACLAMSALADARLGSWACVVATGLAASMQVLVLFVTDARFAVGQFTAGARWAAFGAAAGFVGVCAALMADGDAALVVAAQAVSQGGVLVFAAVAATRASALAWTRPSPARIGILIGQGMRSLALPLAIVVVSRFDRIVLAVFDTAAAVAVYALAATIVEITRLAPTAIGQFTTREVAIGTNWHQLRHRMIQAGGAAAVGGVGLAVVTFVTVPLVFGSAYAEAVPLTAGLLVSEIMSALVIVSNLAIIGGGWSVEAIRLSIVAIGVAVPAYAFGAMLGGMYGVAIAKALIFGILAVLMWSVVRRKLTSSVRATR